MRIMVTGGGAPGIAGTMHALRYNDDQKHVEIITVDARDDVVGKYLSDKFYKIPKASDMDFINVVLDIAKKEKVDVILPQVTKELYKFAKNISLFENVGIKVVVMPFEALKIANNKYKITKLLNDFGYSQGKFKLISSREELYEFADIVGYPDKKFVVKIEDSAGARGVRIITKRKIDLEAFINEKPSGMYATLDDIVNLFDQGNLRLLCCEYFPGTEYTVDVYRSPISKKIIVIPRTRDVMRTGITFEGRLEKHSEIIEMSTKLSEKLDMVYCFGFQFKLDENSKPKILESNPRVQGTMIMSVFGGANMIYWAVKEALGEEVDLDSVKIKWGLKFKRYWGGIGIYDGEIQQILKGD